MTPHDAETIVAIAALAAQADGQQGEAERARIIERAVSLGLPNASTTLAEAMTTTVGRVAVVRLAEQLSTHEARRVAYDTAVFVCYADGWINPTESEFLRSLASALSIDAADVDRAAANVHDEFANANANAEANRGANAGAKASAFAGATGATSSSPTSLASDQHILDQAILSAALELLPDRLANLAILPLQLRLVHQIGARHGQQMDVNQVKDLAAVFGIGAAAQILEKVVRNTLGGLVGTLGRGVLGGLLGGIAGSAVGTAVGASVTFATTYALGHASEQYYAQGRQLSTGDMKTLFARLQSDAKTLYPTIESRVREVAQRGNIGSVLRGTLA